MRYDLVVTYQEGELDLRSNTTKVHERHKAQMLLSENRKTGQILIEAVGMNVPEEELRKAEREQPNKRFYWLDPFLDSTLNPDFIAHALHYYCFSLFNLANSVLRQLRQSFGIDKYDVILCFSNADSLDVRRTDAIQNALKTKARFASVKIERA